MIIYEAEKKWRYHYVISVVNGTIRYLDIYDYGEGEDLTGQCRYTNAIQWLIDIELGRLRRLKNDQLPTTLAAGLPRLLTEHGLHLGEPESE